ncbi:replication-associated recombination protein RarA [Chryseobacterium ginsenosidimutans]|uniref:hypothetical protein n=1 Tax=Chryseobacterium ginsenosidimutans TaxID=687846 RepID=UPI002785C06B|nr:hypothetical protein [Chryseobacterium ginsenosidimutans]MDQ0592179.1 replication-associated recombination protein RarA [Chryseobacterium ginsenosidimutans]
MSYQLKTQSGINFFTCSSAFQKFVRRGMEHEALWFGTELYISGYEEYVWFRMRVMVCEDVGLANPQLTARIQSLYQVYLDFKKKKNKHGPERLPFVNALLLLVRSEKSRIVDNILCEYIFLRETIEVPNLDKPEYDFVWDMHTLKGKKMGRGNDHFYEEAGKITNEPDWLLDEEYEIRDRVWKKYSKNDSNENFQIPNLFDDTEN